MVVCPKPAAVVSPAAEPPAAIAAPTAAVADSTEVTVFVPVTTHGRGALSLRKTAPARVRAGRRITWTLTVTNTGSEALTNAMVRDPVPDPAAVVKAPVGGSLRRGVITVPVGQLAPGERRVILIGALIPATSGGRCFTNRATATATPAIASARTCITRSPRTPPPGVTG